MTDRPSPRTGRLPILVYHHVGPARSGTLPSLTVTRDRFRRHLEWLRRHRFQAVSLDEAAAWANGSGELPARSVMVTFDDGYADLAADAFPLLEAARMRAAVFVVTAQVGGSSAWDAALGGGGHRLLSAQEIRLWSERGIEFGAHTRTHPDLTTLSDSELDSEIVGSADDLEAVIDRRVDAFAYPFSLVDRRSLAIVRDRFEIAFTVFEGTNRRSDPHQLERTMVQPYDRALDIATRVRLGYSPRERTWVALARWKRRLIGARPGPASNAS
jgi:peptidoglycan/xylan/chitin deacetylase (PgdA/CDA1 family)